MACLGPTALFKQERRCKGSGSSSLSCFLLVLSKPRAASEPTVGAIVCSCGVAHRVPSLPLQDGGGLSPTRCLVRI